MPDRSPHRNPKSLRNAQLSCAFIPQIRPLDSAKTRNYVRVKCTLCGSTKGITYRQVEGDSGLVRAETCDNCRGYVKILQQQQDPALEPVADDVASLALDLLVRELGYRRGAVNPFMWGH